jgi:hypothetical protein
MKAAKAKCAGINRERIPKEREKNPPNAPENPPTPNNVENREKIIKMLQIPRTAANVIAMVRNLKYKSEISLVLKSVNICKTAL